MKLIAYSLLCAIPFGICKADSIKDDVNDALTPCMNIKHSPEVISCLINLRTKKEKAYTREFHDYLKSVKTSQETQEAKSKIIELEIEAKRGWDIYSENTCLSGVVLYEKGSYGYDAKYYICLIEKLDSRIKYYRKNKF